MGKVALGMMLAVFVVLAGVSASSAASLNVGGGGVPAIETLAEKAGYGHGYCKRLRRACIYKEERGEQGEGNCRRYRRECGQVSYCERLRRACVYKEERGQEGRGNCRRYRNECGGRRDW